MPTIKTLACLAQEAEAFASLMTMDELEELISLFRLSTVRLFSTFHSLSLVGLFLLYVLTSVVLCLSALYRRG